MNNTISTSQMHWVRSKDGIFAGVCSGLSQKFGLNPWMVRALWLALVLFYGTGVLFYLILAYALPREDRLSEASLKRFLGVCTRIARKTDMDIGLVRTLTILLGLVSLGSTMVGYVVLYFVLPADEVVDVQRIEQRSAIRM